MSKDSGYDYEETMVTLTDEDGNDRDFYIDEIYEVNGTLYAAISPLTAEENGKIRSMKCLFEETMLC